LERRRFARIRSLFGEHGIRRKELLSEKPIITSIHHIVRGKNDNTREKLKLIDNISDAIHFFASDNIDLCKDLLKSPIFHLPYWLCLERFQPVAVQAKSALRKRLGLPGDRLIIGSFQRDTEGNLTTPKLEKGPDVFCDVLEGLGSHRCFALLAGPRRNYIEERLDKAGIGYKSLGHVPIEEMPSLYHYLDYYLVTSRVEGGPQAILESMATRTPIYSTPVGIAAALDPSVVLSTAAEFVEALSHPYPDVLNVHENGARAFDVKSMVGVYERAFEHLIEGFRRNPSNLPAETPEITWHNL